MSFNLHRLWFCFSRHMFFTIRYGDISYVHSINKSIDEDLITGEIVLIG